MPSDRPRLTVCFDSDETKTALEAIAQADDRAASNFVLRLIKQAIRQAKNSGSSEDGGVPTIPKEQ